jgi:hypothetical protein
MPVRVFLIDLAPGFYESVFPTRVGGVSNRGKLAVSTA